MVRPKNNLMSRDRQGRLNRRRFQERQTRMNEIRGTERINRIRAIVNRSIRRRLEREALPSYEIDVTRADGNIHTISARPVTTGANNFSLEAAQRSVAALLRIFTRDEVVLNTGWTRRTAMNRVSGYIQVTNILNPSSSQFYSFANLAEITQEKIDEIFFQMQQSETEVPFENLEFMVVIKPSTYQLGAGTELSLKRGKGLGWETYYDAEGPINCAAISLILLTRRERFDRRKDLLKK
jgi:hypothetical protein